MPEGMMSRSVLIGGIVLGCLAITPASAGEVQFVTLEMRGFWTPAQPELVQAAHHHTREDAAPRRDARSDRENKPREQRPARRANIERQRSLAPAGIVVD
jgi:hypothetical protein